ncbi:hypothetical protein BD560DRAFT_429208 [Blakeslea trispora]|nr:hypothetical protein BD560DRAFT_429594 [Blakeslea trispora]KAI8330163.1 hypothetical protein BD560DRAFT_429208 [Blakeslea trispora]
MRFCDGDERSQDRHSVTILTFYRSLLNCKHDCTCRQKMVNQKIVHFKLLSSKTSCIKVYGIGTSSLERTHSIYFDYTLLFSSMSKIYLNDRPISFPILKSQVILSSNRKYKPSLCRLLIYNNLSH